MDDIKNKNEQVPVFEQDAHRDLPQQLISLRLKRYIAAAVIAAISLIMAISFRDAKCFMFLTLSAYLWYKAVIIKKDYESGRIVEKRVFCNSIRRSTIKDSVVVTFSAEGEDGELNYYQFTVPGKNKADEFVVGSGYKICFDICNPRVLLTCEQC